MENCIKCNIVITEINKVIGRNSCTECERKRRKDYINEKNKKMKNKLCDLCITKKINDFCNECKEKYSKICLKCKEIKLLSKYSSMNHSTCKQCSPEKKKTSKEEWLQNNSDKKEKVCNLCNETKNINDFSYRENNFRNQCKKCISQKKYYKVCRDKKREKNEEEYLKHNTEIHRKWVSNNKEHCQKYNKEYNSTFKRRVNNAISKAKKKQDISDENRTELYDLFSSIMASDCTYCGENKCDTGKYNGVDRIDSSKCYSYENCKPCCITCNYMKNTMDIGSFLKKCTEISIYNNLNEISKDDYRLKFHKDIVLNNTNRTYNSYKYDAVKRNIKFNISEEEFWNIVENNCYLCGKTNSEKIIGIDRVDNNIGYEINNCKSCCKYCNYMKNKNELTKFLEHVQKIVKYTKDNEEFKNNNYTFFDIFQKTKHNFENKNK